MGSEEGLGESGQKCVFFALILKVVMMKWRN